jgi:hypothetical protein
MVAPLGQGSGAEGSGSIRPNWGKTNWGKKWGKKPHVSQPIPDRSRSRGNRLISFPTYPSGFPGSGS